LKITSGRSREAALALLVATAVVAGCTRPGPAAPAAATAIPEKQVQVKTAPVQRADVVSALSYSGDVKSRNNLTVVPKGSGRVVKLNVDVGSPVKVGDVIAELDKDTPQLAVRQAEAQLASAQARLETMKLGARAGRSSRPMRTPGRRGPAPPRSRPGRAPRRLCRPRSRPTTPASDWPPSRRAATRPSRALTRRSWPPARSSTRR
jgi:multidrug efflux pump subunit AcrA (membrane-fusion protein)